MLKLGTKKKNAVKLNETVKQSSIYCLNTIKYLIFIILLLGRWALHTSKAMHLANMIRCMDSYDEIKMTEAI